MKPSTEKLIKEFIGGMHQKDEAEAYKPTRFDVYLEDLVSELSKEVRITYGGMDGAFQIFSNLGSPNFWRMRRAKALLAARRNKYALKTYFGKGDAKYGAMFTVAWLREEEKKALRQEEVS